ncbi:MAG: hypothetical protein J6K43_07525 [Lachnospiraceae bacterium]|nr:hypothetical protein [Lachnospiraceae bacterium]
MISNLVDYFAVEQEFYLDKVVYNRIDKSEQIKEYSLNCIDNIDVEVSEDIVKLTVQRALKFNPEEIFELSVSFGAILKFNKEKKGDYEWEQVDLAEEFRENGQFVLGNLMNRISLLIAEITSSFGQSPIILPPGIAPKNS